MPPFFQIKNDSQAKRILPPFKQLFQFKKKRTGSRKGRLAVFIFLGSTVSMKLSIWCVNISWGKIWLDSISSFVFDGMHLFTQ